MRALLSFDNWIVIGLLVITLTSLKMVVGAGTVDCEYLGNCEYDVYLAKK